MYNTINDIRTVHSFSRIEFLQKIDMRISFPAYHPSVTDDFVINKAILFYFFCKQGDFSVTYVKFVREKKLVGIFTQVKLSGS